MEDQAAHAASEHAIAITKRFATCHHEAGHAVISFILGVKFLHIAIWDDENGEVVPERAKCKSCETYFCKHSPVRDSHAKLIHDDLRCEIAVAVAGEIAEVLFTNDVSLINAKEVEEDRVHARESSCLLHVWPTGITCGWSDPCAISDPFLSTMRSTVEQLLRDPKTWGAVSALATHLNNSSGQCTAWSDATNLIQTSGVQFESITVTSLPTHPSLQLSNDTVTREDEKPQPVGRDENRPVIDEKLFKAFELYLSERTRLSTAKTEQSKAYDQTILNFSAGAFALSITFLEKVVKEPNAKGWLYTSWTLFALAMMSTLYSLLASQKAFEGEVEDLDMRHRLLTGLPAEDTPSPTSPMTAWGVTLTWLKTFADIFTPSLNAFRATVKWLNRFAGSFFFLGVLTFGWFALENWVLIKEETTAMATTKTPTIVKDAPVRPINPGTGAVPDRGQLPPITPTAPPKGQKP